MTSREKARRIAKVLEDKKGSDIAVLNVGKVSDIASYFIVATGSSSRHAKSLADLVEEALEKSGVSSAHKEGYAEGLWVLLDYRDVVVHIFQDQMRTFYDLEHLWQDAPRVSFSRHHG